ncbi:MAG TPA: SPOR domain-containing protein [bacterium]|nr:SPOR domain-containing protein [bacterium]
MKFRLLSLLCLMPYALFAQDLGKDSAQDLGKDFAQSAAAESALASLTPKAGDVGFAATAIASAATLGVIDDELWLLEMLASKAIAADQRKLLVIQRASLLELSGRYGDAAVVWESAVTMIPGKPDSGALLSAAACRLVSGDIDGASGLVTALSFSSADAETGALSDVLAGWIALSRGERENAVAAARKGSGSANTRVAMAALYLGCAATDGADRDAFSGLLYKRFPVLSDDAAVSALSLIIASTATIPTTAEKPVTPTAVSSDQTTSTRYYQVGAFKDQSNARALAQKLEKLGLTVAYRLRSKKDLYIVFVESGADSSATILRLKDAGYEAWPLDESP